MPRRKPAYRRVTPLASRRETQRRAALARPRPGRRGRRARPRRLRLRRQHAATGASARSTPASRRSTRRKADLAKVTGPGIDLVDRRPEPGAQLLTDAYQQLDAAERPTSARRSSRRCGRRSSPASTGCTASCRSRRPRSSRSSRRRMRRAVRPVGAWSRARTARRTSSTADEGRLPDRPQDQEGHARRPRTGRRPSAGRSPTPRFLARRRPGPAHPRLEERPVALAPGRRHGQGHAVQGHASRAPRRWGDDVIGIGTFLRDAGRSGLYNLYVVDPSEQQIQAYSPAADGGGFPAKPTGWLATARDVRR